MRAWVHKPIVRWPGELRDNDDRPYHRFDSTWSATTELLCRELMHLGADNTVMQLAVNENQIRVDGGLREGSKPSHPGVILSFDSMYGPLQYATDQFDSFTAKRPAWQANVRAIAKSLEALRMVDRYGVTKRGEQYTGWGALPPATPMGAPMDVNRAIEILHSYVPTPWDHDDRDAVQRVYRQAARVAHPDMGGSAEDFRLVKEAAELLMGGAW